MSVLDRINRCSTLSYNQLLSIPLQDECFLCLHCSSAAAAAAMSSTATAFCLDHEIYFEVYILSIAYPLHVTRNFVLLQVVYIFLADIGLHYFNLIVKDVSICCVLVCFICYVSSGIIRHCLITR